jgi:hypothetical protein
MAGRIGRSGLRKSKQYHTPDYISATADPPVGECIIGVGWPVTRYRYQQTRRDSRDQYTHRMVWEDEHGEIPEGMEVCHKCDNPPCCNLDHLFLGTRQDNVEDAKRKGRVVHGGRCYNTRLTEETAVYAMARMLFGETQQSIGQSIGVQQQVLSDLWTGKTWRRVFIDNNITTT